MYNYSQYKDAFNNSEIDALHKLSKQITNVNATQDTISDVINYHPYYNTAQDLFTRKYIEDSPVPNSDLKYTIACKSPKPKQQYIESFEPYNTNNTNNNTNTNNTNNSINPIFYCIFISNIIISILLFILLVILLIKSN